MIGQAAPAREQDAAPAAADRGMPLWAVSLGWEMQRGRQVIVSGQIRDRWWLNGEPVPFRDLLVTTLVARGAEVVGWWDPVDGLTFPWPGHEARFAELRRRPTVPDAADANGMPPLAETGAGPDTAALLATPDPAPESEEPDGGRSRRATARLRAGSRLSAPSGPGRLISLEDTAAVARQIVAGAGAATAFVFQDVDLSLPLGEQGSTAGYLRLRAAMDAGVVPLTVSGSYPHARNAVIPLVGDLSRLPAWFCLEDPRTVTLHVAPPDQAERRLWLSMLRHDFNGSGAAAEADFEALVGLTDGMTGWELDALAKSSHVRRIPVREPAKLLQAHRLNVSVDPWAQLDRQRIVTAADRLEETVVGQRKAVGFVVDALQSAYVGVDFGESGAARPRGAFFFVGPTGVGKTELAKALAELIFGDRTAYARFDMSEYQQEHSAERLAGAPPGFVGFDQGGELTRRVQERPFSVLLFDEIEKAHVAVLDKFLQILEDGRLTDGRGQTAYFSQSLIIFTSNTGSDRLSSLLDSDPELSFEVLERHFTTAVEERFRKIGRPEIFGRLKPGVVVFDMLRPEHIAGICDRLLDQLAASVRDRHQVETAFDRESVHRWVTSRMADPGRRAYGGRQIRHELEPLRREIVRALLQQRISGGRMAVRIDEDGAVRVRSDAELTSGPPRNAVSEDM